MKVSTTNRSRSLGLSRISIWMMLATVASISFSSACDGQKGTIDPHGDTEVKSHNQDANSQSPQTKGKEDHDHKSESGKNDDHGPEESNKAKPLILSEQQIERLGLQLTAARRLSQGGGLYLLPTEAVVEVLDEHELYSLDARGTVMRHEARLVGVRGSRSYVRMQVPAGRRIVTANAALVRLAQLNASDPGEGHGH